MTVTDFIRQQALKTQKPEPLTDFIRKSAASAPVTDFNPNDDPAIGVRPKISVTGNVVSMAYKSLQKSQEERLNMISSTFKPTELKSITPAEKAVGAMRMAGKITPQMQAEKAYGKIGVPTELKGITPEEQEMGKAMYKIGTAPGMKTAETTVKAGESLLIQTLKTGLTIARSAGEQDFGMGTQTKESKQFLDKIVKGIDRLSMKQSKIASTIDSKTQRTLYDFANGAGSLALAMGTVYLTKNPSLAAALLTSLETSDVYNNARNEGKSPEDALAISIVSGAGTYVLEKAGLDFLFKNISSTLAPTIVKSFQGFLVEAGQEAVQQVWQNLVYKMGVNKTQSILDGVLKSGIIGGILSGGVTAGAGVLGATGPQMDSTSVKEMINNKLIEEGVSQEDAAMVSGLLTDFTLSKSQEIYNNLQGSFKESRLVGVKGPEGQPSQRPGIEQPAPVPELGLEAEAKKYKSAEEAIKSGADEVVLPDNSKMYRGQKSGTEGQFFTTDKSTAVGYGEQSGVGRETITKDIGMKRFINRDKLYEKVTGDWEEELVQKHPEIFSKIDKEFGVLNEIKPELERNSYDLAEQISDFMKEKGYSGLYFPDNTEIFIPKSQLTDIWNKANQKSTALKTGIEQPALLPETPEEMATTELEKLKTLEEEKQFINE
ncbi:MAG: hypothetical protein KKH98_10520, partial [Spirochaetes bacterium]|nr:hypothetical protein [Spirochaetota bacterium]